MVLHVLDTNFSFISMQMNLGGKVQLVIVNFLGNILNNLFDIPTWN
jgi:hypothetical protein